MSNMVASPSRRAWLQSLALAGLAASPLKSALGASMPDAWHSSYAPYAGPLNAGFNGVLEHASLRVEGRLPAALKGTLYRNGPARMRLGDSVYNHWFDGDGMVQAFHLSEGKARHRGVLLRTPKSIEEEAAGRFLYPAFGSRVENQQPVQSPDTLNVANINLLAMNDGRELYALWEAGSALKIDPQTLAPQGFKIWSPDTAGAPFSAHPRLDPEGNVWNFGYLPGSGKLILYDIAANGGLRRQAMIDAPQADMVHDFAITQRHLIFLLAPLAFQQSEQAGAYLDQYAWRADAPLIALVVDKRDWSTQRFELPNGGVFHLGNAWEERGILRFGYARQGDILGAMQHMRVAPGTPPSPSFPMDWMEVELDLGSGRARQHGVGLSQVEFPRFDQRHTGLASSLTVLLHRSASMPNAVRGFNAVVTLRHGKIERHDYGHGWIAEEHIHVPDRSRAGEGTGWIVGTAYHWPSERTTLSVFDAQGLAQGPLARVHLPYGLPLGLHGQFVAAA